jgi:GNAT superfamily N-acetyltransferase
MSLFSMPSQPVFTTKELSPKTWPDFLKLFCQGSGWDSCCCMHFHRSRRLPKSAWLPTRAQRAVRNRREKRALIEGGRAHGILVYADREPVGWCQFGPREELPRIDNARKYRAVAPKAKPPLWRITCFAVLKPYRRLGAASAALEAALKAIARQGGGLVEAYPIDSWLPRTFGNQSTHGTISMFSKAGFKPVASLGATRFSSHVLVHKFV